MFCLKITVTSDSGERPASAAVSAFVINLLSPTTMSTRVVLRVSSSSQGWHALILSLSSRPVMFGMMSRAIASPFNCRNETLMAICRCKKSQQLASNCDPDESDSAGGLIQDSRPHRIHMTQDPRPPHLAPWPHTCPVSSSASSGQLHVLLRPASVHAPGGAPAWPAACSGLAD